jgi:hypothetical protein
MRANLDAFPRDRIEPVPCILLIVKFGVIGVVVRSASVWFFWAAGSSLGQDPPALGSEAPWGRYAVAKSRDRTSE